MLIILQGVLIDEWNLPSPINHLSKINGGVYAYAGLRILQKNQDYLAEGKPEPSSRSQTLIFQSDHRKWWIKVTFVGSVLK